MHCKGACMKQLLDVLMILDALEKEGSFAAASAKLYKTPSALSYTVHKLESDLNLFEPVWIGWNEQTAGLASGWWRDEILANSAIAGVYAKSDDGKSAI